MFGKNSDWEETDSRHWFWGETHAELAKRLLPQRGRPSETDDERDALLRHITRAASDLERQERRVTQSRVSEHLEIPQDTFRSQVERLRKHLGVGSWRALVEEARRRY